MIINFQIVHETVRDVAFNSKSLNAFEALKFIEEAGYTIDKEATVKVVHRNASYDEINSVEGRKMPLTEGDTIVIRVNDCFTPNADATNKAAGDAEEAFIKQLVEAFITKATAADDKAGEPQHKCKCGGKCRKADAKLDEGTTIKFVDGAVEVTTKDDKGEKVFYRLTGNQIVARSVNGSVTVTAK
jgi:hypothetical protein